ncbi:outer membrane protein assembly factor BamE [Candidatus Pelagibacter bacterium]|nr:outer membrane protein assembly factor BamE [Candidatus Pelagibacter bacterium]
MSLKFKYYSKFFLLSSFIILIGCQFQDPYKNHGIVFLQNRSDKLTVEKSNKNDVLQLIGQPHTKSIDNKDEWIYFERILTKGEYHKLGRNVLKESNILVLNFDKYGILNNKIFFDKKEIQKVKFSEDETKNEMSQKSFVQKFLSSVKSKMYSNRD